MKTMTEFDILEVCRLCLGSEETLSELTGRLNHIISTCFSIKICTSTEVTNRICQACVDQLVNMYRYRKIIIKNQCMLLKKLRENIADQSTKLYMRDLQKDSDFEQAKSSIVKSNVITLNDIINISDNEIDSNDTNAAGIDQVDSELKIQKKNLILEIGEDTTEQKEVKQNSVSFERINDLKVSSKQLGELKTVKTDSVNDLDESLRDEEVIKKENNEDLTTNKNSLEEHEISTIPIAYESVNQNESLETDKENTDNNSLCTNDFPDKGKASILQGQDKKADVILKQDNFYVTNIDKKFMCLTCMKIFESQKELSIHYKTVELSKSMKQTSRKYKEPSVVEVLKNGDGKIGFKCGICSKDFENKTSVVKHARVHKVDRPFLCNLCSRTYKTVDDILRHGVVHSGNKFVCSFHCGYTTVHLGALREHVKRHNKEFKYKCDKCGKCFQVKTWYEQHQNVHDKVRPFVCKLCGQAFSMARYLTAHRANVHPQSSKVKRYKCVQCALPCDSRKTLVMHMKQKHGMKTDCLCDVCGQILPDQQKLSLHKSVHEATRKYSCRFCKKTFNKKDHKTVHEKIHTGERLSCNNCPKSFTQRYSLRRHIKRYHQEDQQTLELKS